MNNTPVNDGINAKGDTCHFRWRAYYWQAQAALAAARPFHMEEAAGIAEDCDPLGLDAYSMQEAIRHAIRAAKTDGGGA